MKKTGRIVWILVAACLGLGVVLAGAGLALGATLGQTDLGMLGFNKTDIPHRDGWQELIKESYNDQITGIDISAGVGEVVITEGDTFSIEATGDRRGQKIRSRVEHGIWKIETDTNHTLFGSPNRNLCTIFITLPKGFAAKEFSADIGLGSLTADVLRTDKLELEVGMGSITVDAVEVAKESDLTASMGQLVLAGSLLGQTDIECGMGQVTIVLTGSKNDYGCVGEVGMGQITFGDSSVGGMASGLHWNPESFNQMNIDCSMGQVDVTFTE